MDANKATRQVFAELEGELAKLEPRDAYKLRRDRWVIATMLAGVLMTTPSMLGAKQSWIVWLTLAGLLLELCGLGVLAFRQISDVVPDFVQAKRKFAAELDARFLEHERLLGWLRDLPLEQRDLRLAYIESRLESMSLRYQVIFGAVDKLGFLPLLAGIFVQVQAIKTVSPMAGLLALALIALYGMALWMTRFRLQMQSYARLMRLAQG